MENELINKVGIKNANDSNQIYDNKANNEAIGVTKTFASIRAKGDFL